MGAEAIVAPPVTPSAPESQESAGRFEALQKALWSLALRALTFTSKFVLLLVLARHFAPAEVGLYGLVAGSVAIGIYVLGMDYYVVNTREMLAVPPQRRAVLVRDQVVFHALIYAVALPAFLGVFIAGVLPWHLVVWFYLVLVFEHLSQEAYRLLITLSRPVVANVVLFVRAGAWTVPLMALALARPAWRQVELVLGAWGVGVAVSLVLAGRHLADLDWRAARGVRVDWSAMRRTAVGALPFLAGSLALRGMEYSDRFFLEHFAGVEKVGVYTFYFSIANTVQAFVVASVIQLLYPRAIEAYQRGQRDAYRRVMRQMALGALGMGAVGAAVAGVLARPALRIVRPVYADQVDALWLLLGSAVISVIAMVPNYALFVRRRDRTLLSANLVGVAMSLGSNAVLVPRLGLMGAATTSLVASCSVLLVNGVALMHARGVENAAT